MTNRRLADILDEVTTLQQEMKKLLDEAVTLSGRAVGDELLLRSRRVKIIRLEANVAAPFTDGVRRRALSLHATCAPYRTDGGLMKRSPLMLIERLAVEWANVRPSDAEMLAIDAAEKRPSAFAHGLQALHQGARAIERRGGGDRRKSSTK